MNKIVAAVALALLAGAAQADTSLMVFGTSHHFNTQGQKYNEFNYGLGLEWQPQDSGWLIGGFALRDSLYNTGFAAYGGYRFRHEFDSGFHVEATLRAGYLRDAKFAGAAVVPSIGFGYKRVTFETTFIPAVHGNHVPTLVLWARIKF